MKSETRSKTIHYKRAVITNSQVTLQNLLETAFNSKGKATKAKQRREILNQDDESCRLINHHKDYNGMLFGQLVFFEPGRSQVLITLDDDADFYEIDSITPDSIGKENDVIDGEKIKKRREFIDSMLYFGVLDNHVVIMQSASLRARELEAHLSWLLGSYTEVMDRNSALILQDKPSEKTVAKIEKSPVKSVHLGTPVETRAQDEDQTTISSEESGFAKKVKWIPCGMGADVIQAALGADWFNRLNLDSSLDEANLQVTLEITYLRKTTSNGQKMLDNIATALRHVDGSDVKINLHGGGTINGSDLKLTGLVSVKAHNGLVDESDLYHQMHSWIVTKVRTNEIEVEDIDS
ncbi:MAG: hypothetical protein M0Q44_01175 [Methylobacter sp.]|nr:hypothetical protein [Methylobacter sp.]